jgi:TPR repeat protein
VLRQGARELLATAVRAEVSEFIASHANLLDDEGRRLAADQGYARARNNLGSMYAKGEGVVRDYQEAARWYRLAAEQGFATGQYNLGNMFARGEGIPKDPATAYMWWSIASATGDEEARLASENIEKEMTRDQITDADRQAKVCIVSGYRYCD